MRDKITDLLQQLNTELEQHPQLDDSRREALQQLTQKLETLVEEPAPVENHEISLEESLVLFEEEHPKFHTILREIERVLVSIGI